VCFECFITFFSVIKVGLDCLESIHQIKSNFLISNFNFAYGKRQYNNSAIVVAPGVIIIFHAPLHKMMSEDVEDIIVKANMIDD
jgi:hypothetical protein